MSKLKLALRAWQCIATVILLALRSNAAGGNALRLLTITAQVIGPVALSFSLALHQPKEKVMRRAVRPSQSDLFNTPASTTLSALGPARAEVTRLLCALLLEVLSPKQPQPVIKKEEQA
jgi:hypothetical protein